MYFPVSATLIEFLILSIVKDQDSYGYDISQTIKLVANIKESTLYPILKKLEKAGFLKTYSQEHQGRQRKYYQLTTEGHTQLAFLDGEWQNYKANLDAIIEGSLRHDKN
ncbi:PadR family transcriptional regulator [Streptococcus bovimastitidis]|uniref:PadR family transcriptional regulator n=1 Tax=Streptococcus bovimastitidis TaxID=1856638 RepID=A0A1L8MMD1_9STRE|nr:PadR family transcriptional regulator [Streptococcus bovimastitidis]OJF71899.1 PadR family transcriptional regulator [Streptococcus bovimastitidis]